MSRMRVIPSHRARWALGALAVVVTVFLAFPGTVGAQLPLPSPNPAPSPTPAGSGVIGEATALSATVFGMTTALASTGSLVDELDVRAADLLTGSIPSVGGAEVLQATAISSIWGWDAGDQVSSAASLAELALTVAGIQISAAFVIAEAEAPVGVVATGWSSVESLAVNGVPISVTGGIGETISLPGLTIVVNEVLSSASGVTVNALHIRSLDGLVDVVVASATAGVR